jgi:hypothetical protein
LERNADRLGNRRGVNPGRFRVVIEGVSRLIPELYVTTKSPLLLNGKVDNRDFDFDLRRPRAIRVRSGRFALPVIRPLSGLGAIGRRHVRHTVRRSGAPG